MPHAFDPDSLVPRIREYLTKRGLPVEILFDERWRPVRGNLEIPLFRPGDEREVSFATRYLDPSWKGDKFKNQKGKSNVVHVPRSRENPKRVSEGKETLWITEGPVKATALVLRGACAVSVNGVWGWRGKVGRTTEPLRDLEFLGLAQSRHVILLFDSDAADNENVERAEQAFAAHLVSLGARVSIARLPAGPNGEKQGADDFLAAHPRFQIAGLAKLAKPFTPPEVAGTVLSRNLARLKPRIVEFLWGKRIPLGKVTLLAGHPGLGKSQLSVVIAAAITKGKALPGGTSAEPASVIFAVEDDPEDTLVPRMIAAGGKCSRVEHLDGVLRNGKREPFTLHDVAALRQLIEKQGDTRLVVVDPISLFLGTHVDAHRANEVRPVLDAVGRLLQELRVAMLIVAHLRKAEVTTALHAISGSVDFGAFSRSALFVGKDPYEKDRMIVAHAKANLSKLEPSLAFKIDDAGVFRWDGTSDLDADQIARPSKSKEQTGATQTAIAWLTMVLQAGPVPVTALKEQAQAEGVKWRTIERAKDEMGVLALRSGPGWCWALPEAENGSGLSPRKAAKTANKAAKGGELAVLTRGKEGSPNKGK